MADDGPGVFVSSSMSELPDERKSVKRALKSLNLVPFTFEDDAHASMHSSQHLWRKELERAQACIVIIHKKLGKYTKDEIKTARKEGLPIIVYRKKVPFGTRPKPDQKFIDKLEDPEKGVSAREYDDPADLGKKVRIDLPALVREAFEIVKGVNKKKLSKKKTKTSAKRRSAKSTEHGNSAKDEKGPTIKKKPLAKRRRIDANPNAFVGRSRETSKLKEFFTLDERRMAVVGEGGTGRKALLRHFAHTEDLQDLFKDGTGIHPVQQAADDLEDVRQAIWEEFYVAKNLDPSHVAPKQRRRDLGSRKALIFLLDTELSDQELAELADDMPKSKFIVTRAARAKWNARQITMPTLDSPDDILALFEDRYNAPVPAEAADLIVKMATDLEGRPARIEMIAMRAWDEASGPDDGSEGHPLVAWAEQKSALNPRQLLDWLIPEEDAEVVQVMTAVDTHTPREVLAEVIDVRSQADDALADGVAIAASPRYALNPALEDVAEAAPDRDAILGKVFEATMAWVADETTTIDRIYQERAFVLRMLEFAESVGNDAGVIKLARSTEYAFAMGARHGAWEQALTRALTAGRKSGDPEATAWALHQLGTRALLRDELDDAREMLHDALEIREDHCKDAVAVTRENLGLIPMAITSLASFVLFLLLAGSWGATLAAGSDGWPVATDVEPTTEENTPTTSLPEDNSGDEATGSTTTPPDDDPDDEPPVSTTTQPVAPDMLELANIRSAPDRVPATGGLVTLSFELGATGSQPLTVGDVSVTISGVDRAIGAASCTGQEVSAASACSVDAQVSGPSGVVTLNVAVSGRDMDDEPVTATGSTSVTILAEPPVIAPELSIVSSSRIAAGEVTLEYLIRNTGGISVEGIAVTDDLRGPAFCPSAVLAVGAAQTCSTTHTPTPSERAAQRVTATATVTAAGLEISPRTTVTAAFGLVDRTVTLDADGTFLIDFDGAITEFSASEGVPLSAPVVVAEGSRGLRIWVGDSWTLTTAACGISSSASLPFEGPRWYETSLSASTTAAAACSFSLVGEAVIEIDDEVILTAAGEASRITLWNRGSRRAENLTFGPLSGFRATNTCGPTLEPDETCTAEVTYIGDPTVASTESLTFSYGGRGSGDNRVLLRYQP